MYNLISDAGVDFDSGKSIGGGNSRGVTLKSHTQLSLLSLMLIILISIAFKLYQFYYLTVLFNYVNMFEFILYMLINI